MSPTKAVRLTEAHLDDVAGLEQLSFGEPWSKTALSLLTGEEALGFVCLEDGRAVAYGGMMLAPDEAQVTNIATHPDFRRRGLAREVTGALIREAQQRGLEQIVLEVRASNEGAIALYRALGFEQVGVRRRFYRAPTEDALVMIKRLI